MAGKVAQNSSLLYFISKWSRLKSHRQNTSSINSYLQMISSKIVMSNCEVIGGRLGLSWSSHRQRDLCRWSPQVEEKASCNEKNDIDNSGHFTSSFVPFRRSGRVAHVDKVKNSNNSKVTRSLLVSVLFWICKQVSQLFESGCRKCMARKKYLQDQKDYKSFLAC